MAVLKRELTDREFVTKNVKVKKDELSGMYVAAFKCKDGYSLSWSCEPHAYGNSLKTKRVVKELLIEKVLEQTEHPVR